MAHSQQGWLHPFLLLVCPGTVPTALHTLTHTLLTGVHGDGSGLWQLLKDTLWGEWFWSPGEFREMQNCLYHLPRYVGGHWRL